MKIRKKILTDENNEPVAVQIDYKDWLECEKILNLQPAKVVDLADFSGSISLPVEPLEFQKKIRDDWN